MYLVACIYIIKGEILKGMKEWERERGEACREKLEGDDDERCGKREREWVTHDGNYDGGWKIILSPIYY